MEPSTSLNPSPSTFQSNNFQVKLALKDTQLVIDAEQSVLGHFQLIITPERVQELTSSVFEDLQFLHAGLLEAFEDKNPAIKVDISDDGWLTYSEEQELRGLKRVKKFKLNLKEEIVDDANRQGRQLNLQARKIVELEAIIVKLEQENNQLRLDLEKHLIEKKVKIEDAKTPEVTSQTPEKMDSKKNGNGVSFDTACTQAGKFLFSNNNKTITYQGPQEYSICIAQDPLQKRKKTQFSVKADSIASSAHVMIGILPSNVRSSADISNKPGIYCYFGNLTGCLFLNGQPMHLSSNGLKTGDIITIIADLSNKIINFELNGNSFYNAELDSSLISKYDYYPFVELYDPNDKVSFL